MNTNAQKLEALTLRKIEFRRPALVDALEFLQREARRLGGTEAPRIDWLLPGTVLAHPVGASLYYEECTLRDVLADLVDLAGLALRERSGGAYVLTPAVAATLDAEEQRAAATSIIPGLPRTVDEAPASNPRASLTLVLRATIARVRQRLGL